MKISKDGSKMIGAEQENYEVEITGEGKIVYLINAYGDFIKSALTEKGLTADDQNLRAVASRFVDQGFDQQVNTTAGDQEQDRKAETERLLRVTVGQMQGKQ